ncbi:MAG: PD40 domain-containing protein [Planctomycetes bacterium]|nr:PD40 domain-containing protein [Planctomycetota bacterium]
MPLVHKELCEDNIYTPRDGKQLAFGSFNNNPFGLWVLDVNTQQAVQVAKGRYTMPAWSKDGRKLAFDLRSGTTREVRVVDTKILTKLTQ